MSILVTWKKDGMTMGQHLDSLELYQPATYAGRLDPLAEGVVPVLTGKHRHHKENFLGLDKTYDVTCLFGIESDTHDALGLLSYYTTPSPQPEALQAALSSFMPEYKQSPPMFSSIPIKGQPSFVWAKTDNPITPPQRTVTITSIDTIRLFSFSKQHIIDQAVKRVERVHGDFRQNEIITSWKNLENMPTQIIPACTLRVTCGSGTYIRSLARDLGAKLNTSAIVWRLVRTRVGHLALPN